MGRRPPGWFYAAVAAAVVVAVVWVVAFSPIVGVNTVTVRGAAHVTDAEVRAAAHIKQGSPLVRLDTAAIRHRIERLPQVASASVRLSYPSTVIITVHERTAVGYVESGDGIVLIDATGVQFRHVDEIPRNLPRFDLPINASAADLADMGTALAQVSGALPSSIRQKLSMIQATAPSQITLVLTDHRTVFWGGTDRSADKAQLLSTLLTRPGTTFDVSDPDLVVAR